MAVRSLVTASLLFAAAACPVRAADILYALGTGPQDGGYGIDWGLTADANGNLFGTASRGGPYQGGAEFELSPSANGYVYTVIGAGDYGATDLYPTGNLLLGDNGVLYGTEPYNGQGYGDVFSLTPPAAGSTTWTRRVIFSFSGTNGSLPVGLVRDASGALYGSALQGGPSAICYYPKGCGLVYKLTPPASDGSGAWTETTLYQFDEIIDQAINPEPGLLLGAGGIIYGALLYGQIFALTPPTSSAGAWSYHVIYAFPSNNYTVGFDPNGQLTQDKTGALYGTTFGGGNLACYTEFGGCGVVFKLTPPADRHSLPWTESVLFTFNGGAQGANPYLTGVTMDGQGNLLGSTEHGGHKCPAFDQGVVYELSPPVPPATAWTETVPIHTPCSDGIYTSSPPVLGGGGTVYVPTFSGGPAHGGTILRGRYDPYPAR